MWTEDRQVKLRVLRDFPQQDDLSVMFVVLKEKQQEFWNIFQIYLKEIEKKACFIHRVMTITEAIEPWDNTHITIDLAGGQALCGKLLQSKLPDLSPFCRSIA